MLMCMLQGLADLSGKRSATGVPTDDSGFTFARTAGQVRLSLSACPLLPHQNNM